MTAMEGRQSAERAAEESCAREPIHIPGSIQPHGLLFTLKEPELTIGQWSANAPSALALGLQTPAGSTPEALFGEDAGAHLRRRLAELPPDPQTNPEYLLSLPIAGQTYHAIAHRRDSVLILELERGASGDEVRFSRVHRQVSRFMTEPAPDAGADALSTFAAREVRRITGFDRVLIYRFDPDWNGHVVAEDRNGNLPSYLDLHFPASDIPPQARELYRLNRLRIIPDASYTPVPLEPTLNPHTGRPLDLSFSSLRSVSPVHAQYMKNMGTGSSMSISILRGGELWGLISCHSRAPRMVPAELRSACDIVAQILSAQLAAAEHRASAESRIALKSNQTTLLGYMAEEANFLDALRQHPDELLAATGADSAAVLFGEECLLFGNTPDEPQVRGIAEWLNREKRAEIFATDSLASVHAPAAAFAHLASGLIAASISSLYGNYVLWFRREWPLTVNWGGDPRKEVTAHGTLSPRNSFELWKETVRFQSRPWTQAEADSAADLRNALVRIVLRKAEELAQVSDDLRRSNQELEAFSYSVSHDLRAPFRHISGYAELLVEREGPKLSEAGRRYVRTIVESAQFAGKLVDNLLSFSQIGRSALHVQEIDTDKLLTEARAAAESNERESGGGGKRAIDWHIDPLPPVVGDPFMMRLVFLNLIANALKYTRTRNPASIHITGERKGDRVIFSIRDNGVGFDAAYAGKLFGVFQRLHRMEDFEGTGIGLANVRRIVARHGGQTWAEGEVDRGASFYFSLPAGGETQKQ